MSTLTDFAGELEATGVVTDREKAAALYAAADRLAMLDRWIESRGLPPEWEGPLDAWAWVVLVSASEALGVVYAPDGPVHGSTAAVRVAFERWKRTTFAVRWDRATESQRVEARGKGSP